MAGTALDGPYRISLYRVVQDGVTPPDSGYGARHDLLPAEAFTGPIHRVEFRNPSDDALLAAFDLVYCEPGYDPNWDGVPNPRIGAIVTQGATTKIQGALVTGLRLSHKDQKSARFLDLIRMTFSLKPAGGNWILDPATKSEVLVGYGADPKSRCQYTTLTELLHADFSGIGVYEPGSTTTPTLNLDAAQKLWLLADDDNPPSCWTPIAFKFVGDGDGIRICHTRVLSQHNSDGSLKKAVRVFLDTAGCATDAVVHPLAIAPADGAQGVTLTLAQPSDCDRLRYRAIGGRKHLDWVLTVESVEAAHLARFFNAGIAQSYIDSLINVRDGHRVSLLPVLTAKAGGDSTTGRYRLQYLATDTLAHVSFFDSDHDIPNIYVGQAINWRSPDRWRLLPLTASQIRPASTPPQFMLRFPGLRTHEGAPLSRSMLLEPDRLADIAVPNDIGTEFTLKFAQDPNGSSDPAPTGRTVRMGALDVEFSAAAEAAGESLQITTSIDDRDWPRDGSQGWGAAVHRLSVSAHLALSEAQPGAQDPLPDELLSAQFLFSKGEQRALGPDAKRREKAVEKALRRAPALVFPMQAPGSRTGVRYFLDGEELTVPGKSQSLGLKLRKNPDYMADDPPLSAIVVDSSPFTVASVMMPPLSQATDDTGVDVANWSLGESEGAYWQFAGISTGFTLLFPPQGIGEETYKPSAYESNGRVAFPDDPIDFRFSPNARFTVQSSYYEQNFNEAPWNLRRVMGYAGQRAPGAGVVSASFELLYGLSCSIAPPSTRLSELEARLGAPQQPLSPHPTGRPDGKAFPSPAPSADPVRGKLESVYQDRRKAWAEMLSAYRKRVALFELWREGAADEPYSLDTNIDFAIRTNADLAFPIDPALSTPGEDRWKKVPAELTGTWNDNSGLKGGVLWGFESANILEELLGNTKSTAGLISQPAFSALGGWGYEKAAFSKNKTKIYANTAMGRTFFYSVERIGRIAGCWHRAKHVVVYERTVLPSEQFWPHDASVPPKELADQHSLQAGRPLLRKILEYVEPIERRRAYPEGSESPACAAFLDEIEFKDERIPVDSAWGRDIEGGWVIPLWNPDADAQVYPKPHVVAHLHGDAEGIAVRVPCPFARPDELLFYTTTDPDLDDNTDLWPPVETVDHCNAAPPLPDNLAPLNAADPDGRLADAQALDRGHAALTFSLDPSAAPVNLVASRSAKAMNFVPRNFTISRARPRRAGLSPTAQGISAIAEIRRTIDARKADILNGLDSVTGKTIAQAREKVGRFKADIQGLVGDAHNIADALTPPADLCTPLETFVGATIDTYAKTCADQVKQIAQGLKGEISSLAATVTAPRGLLDDVKHQLTVLTHPLELPLQATAVVLTDAKKSLDSCRAQFDGFISETKSDLAGIESDVDNDIASLEDGATRTGETLDALHTRIGAQLDSIRYLLKNADGGGWIAGPAKIVSGLENGTNAAFGDFKASLSAFSTSAAQTKAQFDALIGGGAAILDGAMTTAVHQAFDGLDAFRKQLFDATGAVADKLDDLQAKIFDLSNVVVWSADLTVDKLNTGIGNYVSTVDGDIRSASQALKDAFHKALHDPPDLCTQLFGAAEITEALTWINHGLDSLADAFSGKLDPLLNNAAADVQALRNRIAAEIDGLAEPLSKIDDKAMGWLKQLDKVPTFADPDGTLRMIRAFGDAPVVPDLKFNRDRMAYFFDDLRNEVATSPAAALLNRAGEDLKALGVRIPTRSLLDRVVPDELQNFDVSKIFSDLGGLKFANMFPDLKMPQISNSNIRVSHRFDKATQTGWVHADLDVPFSGRTKVFAYGPVELYLQSASLTATADVSARLGQSPQQEVHGQISGDWQMTLGGTLIMTFVKTSLSFDHTGKLHFDIAADRVKLDPSLEWLSDLVAALSDPDSGFSVELVPLGGVRCTLDLPLPPIGAGVFAVAGIRLGASFEVGLFPEFYLAIGFNFSRKTYPFTLTIAFLNGGGWIEADAKYFPSTGNIATSVTIGIVAGAGIEFSFGPFEGAVYVEFGIFVDFYSDDKGGALIVGVMILVRGCVNFFSIVNISICLLIQATYDGKQLIGTGTLTASVQICWCLTLSASVAVQYTFAGGQSSQSTSSSAAVTGPNSAELQDNLFDD